MIKEFRIDGGIWADPEKPLASDVWLEGAWELLTEWRAQSTWRRYGPAWRRVKKWLRDGGKDVVAERPFLPRGLCPLNLAASHGDAHTSPLPPSCQL